MFVCHICDQLRSAFTSAQVVVILYVWPDQTSLPIDSVAPVNQVSGSIQQIAAHKHPVIKIFCYADRFLRFLNISRHDTSGIQLTTHHSCLLLFTKYILPDETWAVTLS